MVGIKISSGYVWLVALALVFAPASTFAQVPAPMAPPAPRKPSEEISSKLVNNRMLEAGSWKINALGQGEIRIKAYRGLAFDNRDTGVGNIRFKEGVHQFDIGYWGYDLLKYELRKIVMGGLDPSQGYGPDCGIRHPGFSEISWVQNGQPGSFTIQSICRLSPDMEALRESNANAWRILGRLMMRYGQGGVSDEYAIDKPLKRKPLKLALNHSNIGFGNHIDWEVNPDGKGWFETRQTIARSSWTPSGMPMILIPTGKARFDIGKEGYLRIRRELDAYIIGPASKKECEVLGDHHMPLAHLSWKEDGKMTSGLTRDTACSDYGDRLSWVIAYLGARVAASPAAVSGK
jgi:hypothetical protein